MKTSHHTRKSWTLSTRWHYVLVGGVGIVLLLLVSSCYGLSDLFSPNDESLQEQAPPPWRGEYVSVDLSHMLHPHVHEMEFAAQNAPYLGFWSLDRNAQPGLDVKMGSYEYTRSHKIKTDAPGHYVVIDFQGNIVTGAVTATGALRDRYVELFPTLAARQRYAEFIRGAEFWAFSPDGTYGMKSDTCYELNDMGNEQKGMHVLPCMSFETDYMNFEFWDLTRNELLWETRVKGYAIQLARVLSWQGQAAVLIALPYEAHLVSQATGETLGTFPYTIPQESHPEYQQRFGEWFGQRCRPRFFSSYHNAYNAGTRWLICGPAETRRVRIFAIDPPYPLIREVYADQPPYHPWSVEGLRVNGNGRYLIIETYYGGMAHLDWRTPTEVYDVETWERVWYENQRDIEQVTISPDGKKIAFLRGMPPDYFNGILLELGDFYPAKAE